MSEVLVKVPEVSNLIIKGIHWNSKVEEYVKKGQMLALEGKLVHRSYEKDGQTRYITEVVANELLMLGRNENGKKKSK